MVATIFGKVRPLIVEKQFPMDEKALKFLKNKLVSAALKNVPFIVETNASDNAISALLKQRDRPAAFFSRMLTKNERHHSSVEKKLQLLWKQFVNGEEFLCG